MSKACGNCGALFAPGHATQKWCSAACRSAAWHKRTYQRTVAPPLERLLSRTRLSAAGCLEWTGSVFGARGYGAFSLNGRTIGAHRAHWLLAIGSIPDGLFVMHACDNKICVNLDHLELGTHNDNMAASAERARHRQGERHPRAKVTATQVSEIRERYAAGEPRAQLAREYGISGTQVTHIATRSAWRTVS